MSTEKRLDKIRIIIRKFNSVYDDQNTQQTSSEGVEDC